jgi:hypothetical protein
VKLYLFIVAATFLTSGQSYAKNPTFRVASKQGEFFVWSGLDVGWEPVKTNAIYNENSLFQSMGGSRIDLRQTRETIQGTAKNVSVESKGRIIFRLNEEIVRKLQISNNFVNKIDTGLKVEKKEEEKLDLASAWKKVASLMKPTSNTKGGDSAKVGAGESAKVNLAAADIGERIEVTYPARGGIFVPEALPLVVPVIWKQAANEKGCYEVFLKAVDRTGFKSVGVVKEPRIDVVIKKAGAYVIRVQCATNSARSEEMTFNVLPVDAQEWSKPVSGQKKSQKLKKAAVLKDLLEEKKDTVPTSNKIEEK